MQKRRAQPIRSEYGLPLGQSESSNFALHEGKLRKNALCLNQSAFSNFALYVISTVIQFIVIKFNSL